MRYVVIYSFLPIQTAEFPGSKLHFCFHSDGSNNEWGYKFTVSLLSLEPVSLNMLTVMTCGLQLKAMGKSVCQLGALFDLHLSLAKLLGLLCSATLSTKNGEHFENQLTSHQYRSSHPLPSTTPGSFPEVRGSEGGGESGTQQPLEDSLQGRVHGREAHSVPLRSLCTSVTSASTVQGTLASAVGSIDPLFPCRLPVRPTLS